MQPDGFLDPSKSRVERLSGGNTAREIGDRGLPSRCPGPG
jgi:hypothetical protein